LSFYRNSPVIIR